MDPVPLRDWDEALDGARDETLDGAMDGNLDEALDGTLVSSFGALDAALDGARDEEMEGAAEDASEGERWVCLENGRPRDTGNLVSSVFTGMVGASRLRKQGPCLAKKCRQRRSSSSES